MSQPSHQANLYVLSPQQHAKNISQHNTHYFRQTKDFFCIPLMVLELSTFFSNYAKIISYLPLTGHFKCLEEDQLLCHTLNCQSKLSLIATKWNNKLYCLMYRQITDLVKNCFFFQNHDDHCLYPSCIWLL